MIFFNKPNKPRFMYFSCNRPLLKPFLAVHLVFSFSLVEGSAVFAESNYPDLRRSHDPELQKALDKALGPSHPEFWSGVQKKK